MSFTLEYRAPESCPDENAFVASILSQAPAAERAGARSSARVVFEAQITEHAGVARGFLVVRLASGAVSRRDVPAASCRETVASMAVIAALVLEGMAAPSSEEGAIATPSEDSGETPSQAPMDGSLAPAQPSTPTPLPARAVRPRSAAPRAPRSQPQPPRSDLPARTQPIRPTDLDWRMGVALGAALESAVAPTLALGLALGIDVSADTPGVVSPSARLSNLYFSSVLETTPDGSARFRLLAARLALCPVRLRRLPLTLRPCLELDLGELQGRGEDTRNERTQSLLWMGVGASLQLEVSLGRNFGIESQLGGRVLGKRARFLFLPDTEVHDMSFFSFGGTLGVIGRFP